MKKLIVDRMEGNFAVCETETSDIINISLDILPEGAKEGSVLQFSEGKYNLLYKEEEERKKRISELQDDIFSL